MLGPMAGVTPSLQQPYCVVSQMSTSDVVLALGGDAAEQRRGHDCGFCVLISVPGQVNPCVMLLFIFGKSFCNRGRLDVRAKWVCLYTRLKKDQRSRDATWLFVWGCVGDTHISTRLGTHVATLQQL